MPWFILLRRDENNYEFKTGLEEEVEYLAVKKGCTKYFGIMILIIIAVQRVWIEKHR